MFESMLPNGFFYGGAPENARGADLERRVSYKVSGYALGVRRQGKIPNLVDDAYLKRENGIFGFPLVEEGQRLGFGKFGALYKNLSK